MCGIAGKIYFGGQVSGSEITAMTDTLTHRGPDASGIYLSPDLCCGLGHARLSIIDLAGGAQPMSNEDGTIWLTYNGECYNFAALRNNLISAGHQFKTCSDSEVIIHLYEQYGNKCVEHLRGMFAFAIWDQNRKELFLARDRMGQKPLFYHASKELFIFGSEPKAILKNLPDAACPDYNALTEYLIFGYLGNVSSGFNNISKLPPGRTITVNAQTGIIHHSQYWQLPATRGFCGSYQQAVQAVRDTVTEAVQMRMISDVPLGSFLSGGLDSTIITGIMSQNSSQPVKTCGIGFDNKLYNELSYSRLAADSFNCEHNEFTVSPDCVETIQKLVESYDEPFADSSALPTWHLARLARQRVTVALSGDGGDECFGGYKRHKAIRMASFISRNPLLSRLAGMKYFSSFRTTEHHSRLHYLKRFVSAAHLPDWKCYCNWLGVFSDDMLIELIGKIDTEPYLKFARDIFSSNQSSTAAALYLDGSHYLPADLNTKTDRASMGHGLEVRSPFQDHKVVELAYSLPSQWLVAGKHGKKILRDAFRDIIPKKILLRDKMGFGVPVGEWFRGELRDMYIDLVVNGRFTAEGYFNKPVTEKLLSQNDNHITDNGHQMWTLLMLELWAKRWCRNK